VDHEGVPVTPSSKQLVHIHEPLQESIRELKHRLILIK
jgi:hypothetical protein